VSNETDIAWAAGLFEGEGCITQEVSKHAQMLKIVSTDYDVLVKFMSIVGVGRLESRKKAADHHKDQWQWRVQDAQGITLVLEMLMPHFCLRRYQKAEEMLQRTKHIRSKGRASIQQQQLLEELGLR
jgi:hypothetical protein